MKSLTGFLTALAIAASAAACSQTDSGVTTKVKSKFAIDDVVNAHEINVTTRDGVVTLTGEVPDLNAKHQAVRLARETEGVTDVVDELRVEVAATSGDVDIDVDDDIEEGLRDAGAAIREGVEAVGGAARRAGEATRDAVTDDDPDSDRDGR